MKQTINQINYDWLTAYTGDPFVDAGGYALMEFAECFPDLDLLELIMKVTDIYVDRWQAKINPFFLNSKITQPAFNATKKKEETRSYFQSLIDNRASSGKGFCRITGQETFLFAAGRDNSVLSGSGTFVNFHHNFDSGILLSKEVLIRLHFLPLACEYLQGRIALIHSSNKEATALFARKCCQKNLDAVGANVSDGILKAKSKSAGTALFRFVDDILHEWKAQIDNKRPSLSLYLFTNFGASPEVKIYTLPHEVFGFYRKTQRSDNKEQWNHFVSGYYISSEYKKAYYDETQNRYIYSSKKIETDINECDFKYWHNRVYDFLINNKSIVKLLLKRSCEHELNFNIIKSYVIDIRKMKKETISKIEQIADYILNSNDDSGIKKAIKKLNGVKTPYLLRRFILNDIVARYFNEGNDEAIVTITDYTDYLFPDTSSWQETRDVLLIALYQKMHERNLKIEGGLPDPEDEDIEESEN